MKLAEILNLSNSTEAVDEALKHSLLSNNDLMQTLGEKGISDYYEFLTYIREISSFIQKYSNFYDVSFKGQNVGMIINDFKDIKGISENEVEEIKKGVVGLRVPPLANNIVNTENSSNSYVFNYTLNQNNPEKAREIEIKKIEPKLYLNSAAQNEKNNLFKNLNKFDSKAYKQQLNNYRKALKHIKNIEEDFSKIKNIPNDETRRTIDLMKMYVDAFKPLLQEDMDAFYAHKGEKCTDINQMYSLARNKVVEIDDFEKNKFGSNLSTRYKIDTEFNGFHHKTGFFTKEKLYKLGDFDSRIEKVELFNFDVYEEFFKPLFAYCDDLDNDDDQELLKKLKKVYPNLSQNQYLSLLEESRKEPLFAPRKSTYTHELLKFLDHLEVVETKVKINNKEQTIHKFKIKLDNPVVKSVLNYLPDEAVEYIRENYDKLPFIASLYNLESLYVKMVNSDGINKRSLQLFEGDNISNRNCAMTAVEKLLDLDVLADSHKLTIKQGDKTINGVFMEEADGTDFMDMKPNDPKAYVQMKEMNNPSFLRSVANLQILDYICGNVDRHGGNFFNKFEMVDGKYKLTGVMGIDNDASFSRIIPEENKPLNRLPALKNMLVIDEKLANKVMTIDEDDLYVVLKPYGLSNDEIEAAGARLNNVKRAIGYTAKDRTYFENGKPFYGENSYGLAKLNIVKENDWANLNMDTLAKHVDDSKDRNLFHFAMANIKLVCRGDYGMSIKKEDVYKQELCVNAIIKTIHLDMDQMAKKLENLKSIWWNSDEYNNIIDMLSNKSKKPVKYSGFDISSDRDKNLNIKNNILRKTFNDSYSEIKQLAKIYLDKKEKEAKNSTLDKTSLNKIKGIKEILNYIDKKEKFLLERFDELESNYIKYEAIYNDAQKILDIDLHGGLTQKQIEDYVNSQNASKKQIVMNSLNEKQNKVIVNTESNMPVIREKGMKEIPENENNLVN